MSMIMFGCKMSGFVTVAWRLLKRRATGTTVHDMIYGFETRVCSSWNLKNVRMVEVAGKGRGEKTRSPDLKMGYDLSALTSSSPS